MKFLPLILTFVGGKSPSKRVGMRADTSTAIRTQGAQFASGINIMNSKNTQRIMPWGLSRIKIMGSSDSRANRRNFPEVKKNLWKKRFWARSSFLAATGQIPLAVLKLNIESQGK